MSVCILKKEDEFKSPYRTRTRAEVTNSFNQVMMTETMAHRIKSTDNLSAHSAPADYSRQREEVQVNTCKIKNHTKCISLFRWEPSVLILLECPTTTTLAIIPEAEPWPRPATTAGTWDAGPPRCLRSRLGQADPRRITPCRHEPRQPRQLPPGCPQALMHCLSTQVAPLWPFPGTRLAHPCSS